MSGWLDEHGSPNEQVMVCRSGSTMKVHRVGDGGYKGGSETGGAGNILFRGTIDQLQSATVHPVRVIQPSPVTSKSWNRSGTGHLFHPPPSPPPPTLH